MSQPWQLAKAFKPRKSTRPILEQLPAVSTTELKISSLYTGKKHILKPLKIPGIEGIKRSLSAVEFHFRPLHRGQQGRVEAFRLKPIKTGFGSFRYCFHCNTCATPVERLYYFNHSLVCRWCCNGRYVSRAITPASRPALQRMRVETFINNKRVWQHTRERLLKRFGEKALRPQGRMGTKARSLWD